MYNVNRNNHIQLINDNKECLHFNDSVNTRLEFMKNTTLSNKEYDE